MLLLALSAHATTGPHALHVAEFGTGARTAFPPPRQPLPPPTPGPDLRVYGYLAYWADDLSTVPWDDLTDIAIFSVGANSDGSLGPTGNWDIADDAVAMAAPYGVRVHLCVTQFDEGTLQTLLSSSTNSNALVDELVDWEAATGAHGVNIDFEGLPYAVKQQMVDFTADLDAAVGDVVLATPSVDWAGSWDYSELTKHADLFVMGYGYHWSGSSYAGPVDPLYAGTGTVWSGIQSYSLDWTADDYVYWGGDPARIILGLPLYGTSWPTSGNGVPEATLGTGTSVFFEDAWADAAAWGRSWEADSHTPYTYGGGEQLWYGDEESVQDRIAYVRDETSLAGIGFWALNYDGGDEAFWSMIRDETTTAVETTPTGTTGTGTGTGTGGTTAPPGDWVADAGLPFLAYVGDTVVLSGKGSRGPAGEELRYRWTQVAGPTVELTDRASAEPAFTVDASGTHAFELEVGDGAVWSAPAASYVVVIDPGLARRHGPGCGCDGASGASGGLFLVLAAALRRRR